MNALTKIPATMTKAEFNEFSQRFEGPECEFVGGRVVQQSRTTKTHARIVAGFMRVLQARLDVDVWSITADTIAVEYGDRNRLPDVLVERLDAGGPAMSARSPVVLVEVMSPSSAKSDFYDKPWEYPTLPTLLGYVVASQDEQACWVWARATVDQHFPDDSVDVRKRCTTRQATAQLASRV